DVDYRGSTGYGREYMRALDGNWGVADVDDCLAAARFLVERGDVDGDRLAIRGGSAGGFTVLAALTFHDVFAAGASRYGIGDLEAMTRDTHKFESRYLDGLVGPYPETLETYVARSPVHHTDLLTAPMILLQGSDDKIVPPDQAKQMAQALAEKGLPHAYILFDGEGHGFRQAPNIVRALEAEYSFFAQIFGFTPAGEIESIEIL
ncbi:MAG: S9 family peptidase, partial [Acidimicrobiales bacterium]